MGLKFHRRGWSENFVSAMRWICFLDGSFMLSFCEYLIDKLIFDFWRPLVRMNISFLNDIDEGHIAQSEARPRNFSFVN